MELIVAEIISTATVAISIFGIAFCLMQTGHTRVSRSFAWFLAAVAMNNLPDAFGRLIQAGPGDYGQIIEVVLWLPSSLCLAPLFWIYVTTVTSKSQRRPAHLYRHFFLPALAVLMGLLMLAFPGDFWGSVLSENGPPTFSWWSVIALVIAFLQLAVYPQMAIYLYLILRRMTRYRLMLRDYYASTEEYELRWIYVIGGLAVLFWLGMTFILFLALDTNTSETPLAVVVSVGLVSLCLVGAMALWGLRQSPPLLPDRESMEPHETTEKKRVEQPGDKYEKSALSAEASERIARKLRKAMETDYLYRNPNLSLWILARHIGASPNYISQTLNEVIGENFFDFVNGYRICEAMECLSVTKNSVLTITYDVGFNSRSSFYNAFKRVTGQTPTGYRKSLSQRIGMDDGGVRLGDI